MRAGDSGGAAANLLRALIRIPSVNPDGASTAGAAGEGALARHVGELLSDLGAVVRYDEVRPGRPNVVARFPADRPGKPRLLLAPHTDTVPVAGMTVEPFGGEMRGGKIFGRGACDTKGTLAAMVVALGEIGADRLAGLGHEIWFAGLMGEEAGQLGAHDLAGSERFAFVVVGEPTGCDIVHAHKGCLFLDISLRGRAVHASAPERGENAILKAADLVCFLEHEYATELALLVDPQLGRVTVNCGVIAGGSQVNVVPDRCRLEVDIRTIPEAHGEVFERRVLAAIRGVCPDAGVEVFRAQPLHTDPAHPMVRALVACGGKAVGAPWFCDAAAFASRGMAAVAAGPGDIAQAHTADEWIAVKELEHGVAFYRAFLERC